MDGYGDYPVSSTSKSTFGSGRQRHFYDETQLMLLDAEFTKDSFPNREARRRIAQLIGVSEKSIMWWFQNRRRRFRQLGSSKATSSNRQITRQYCRSSPYVSRQRLNDSYVSSQVVPTPTFYSYPPTVPFLEPIGYSTSDSSSLSPVSPSHSGWVAVASCPQEVASSQSNLSYSDGFQPDQPQLPNQQEYSSYYWNNWEYSPPFYSPSMSNPPPYSNTDYSSSYGYYSPEITNQFYYHSNV